MIYFMYAFDETWWLITCAYTHSYFFSEKGIKGISHLMESCTLSPVFQKKPHMNGYTILSVQKIIKHIIS